MEQERLQKYLANCGVASRRKCEEYISAGLVKVNGKVITELGYKVSKNDEIYFKDKLVSKEENVYFIMNKPEGFLCAKEDKLGQGKTVYDLLLESDRLSRLIIVSPLDYNNSGAILLTNDGELANRLSKKYKSFNKNYQVRINGILDQKNAEKLIKGFMFKGNKTNRTELSNISFDKEHNSTLFEISLIEEYNGYLKDILLALGYELKKIKRLAFADITIAGLTKGAYRPLKIHEIKKLYSL